MFERAFSTIQHPLVSSPPPPSPVVGAVISLLSGKPDKELACAVSASVLFPGPYGFEFAAPSRLGRFLILLLPSSTLF